MKIVFSTPVNTKHKQSMKLKLLLYIGLICFLTYSSYAQNTQAQNKLTEKQLEAFKSEASKKIAALSNYISIIANKSIDGPVRQKSIELAVKLFVDKDQLVQVSSTNRSTIRVYKIGEYLNRLRVLPYSSVEIEWYDITYVSDYRYGSDGKYYAVATVFQKFRGYSAEGELLYEDITRKNIEISVGQYTKRIGDQEYKEWDVLLRQISVLETI